MNGRRENPIPQPAPVFVLPPVVNMGSMTTQTLQTLDHDRFHAAVKAAKDRFSQLKEKHPALKGYLVLSIPGKQAGIGSSPSEILDALPALIADDDAKEAYAACLDQQLPKDASESQKQRAKERQEELSRSLNYDGRVRVEIRFDHLDYALIDRLQSDELVDRELTPQTPASIRIVLGTLAAFAP